MREIKFRAWNKEEKKLFDLLGDYNAVWVRNVLRGDYIESITLLQFTGLKDKNGEEIYEGDILQDRDFDNRWQVGWSAEYASFELVLVSSPHKEFPQLNICRAVEYEAIGNIYENPELVGE